MTALGPWGAAGVYVAIDEEKKKWIEEGQLILRDGELVSASGLDVSQL